MLNVTCIRGPAEAPQENGQKRASVGSPGGQKASSPSIAHTTAANTGFSLSAMFDQGIAAVGGGVGIGVALAIKNGAVVISSIGKGGGADKTGGKIQVNDEIVEIDGKPVEQKLEAVQQKLLGARGSEIKLRLKRYGVFGFQV
jgi:C-terminal processing protease CtpA/Prc